MANPLYVVSNTSPLTNLAAIGQFNLLHDMFAQIYVPAGVMTELTAKNRLWPGATEVTASPWIKIEQVSHPTVVDALRLDLDRGEAEAIALALEKQADLVLLDEQAGRYAAQFLNLKVMGVVGLLIKAKQLGLLKSIKPQLDLLRQQAGFYINTSLYHHALTLAEE